MLETIITIIGLIAIGLFLLLTVGWAISIIFWE